MKKPIPFHYLFCVNRLCKVSLFQNVEEVKVPITSENRDAAFVCRHCNHQLLSAFNNTPRQVSMDAGASMENIHIYLPN